jgi:hypothetical protein
MIKSLIPEFLITCLQNLGKGVNELTLMCLGKDKQAIVFIVFLLFSASAFGQAGLNYKYRFDTDSSRSEFITGNQSLIINYSISELDLENTSNASGTYYRVSIPGHVSSTSPGKPELPVLSRLITVPDGFEYNVKISDIRSRRLNPSHKKIRGILYPAQAGETKAIKQNKPEFLIDRNTYTARGTIASDTVRIEELGTLRNKRLANLYISPVHYNPRTNVLEVITSMKVDITFTSKGISKSLSPYPESDLFAQTLDKTTIDYNPGDVIPGYSTQPVKMVIITDTSFRKQLKPFFRWKTQKGYDLKILYKGAGLAGNNYAELKDTLNKIYKSSSTDDPPPEYLLIIGDVNHIPKTDETSNISDMYYGEFDGAGDYIPEMFIGRLPVSDTNEVKNVVSKIIQYEKFEFADTNKFYNRALISAGNDVTYAVNMNGQLNYVLRNYLRSSNNIEQYHFYYPQSTYLTVEDSIIKIFRKGISFVNYTGHGDMNGWLDPLIKSKDVDSLRNRNMYPFTISNACRTAQYSSPTSFGNRMMLSKDKGAIGFIGCSNDSYWDEDYYWAIGAGSVSTDPTYQTTGLGAYDRLFHINGESPADWYFTMGQIVYAGNMAVSASTSTRKKYYWETYNLIGDPSVIPIIGKPGSLSVNVPDTLPNGIKSLTLKADPFTYLALSHSDTLWDASYVSASGSVELTMPGLSNDSCLMVVTGQNKKPIIKTIRFSNVKGEYINLTSSSINDIQGNNNKRVDFGESFFLNLTVSNLGLTDANNLYAKISSSSDILTIGQDSVYIGTLRNRSEKLITDKLEMKISGNVIDMGIVTIDLLLKDSKTEKHYKIDICIHAPELSIANCLLNDTLAGNKNNVADPGETFYLIFKVMNQGSSNVSGQFYVTSTSSDLTILEPTVKSGDLKFGETTDIPVKVKLSESASSGSFIYLSSLLDCTPYVLNKDFSFRVGRIRESFESSSFNVFPWINISSVPWTITGTNPYDGVVSARSGQISHNASTSLLIRTVFEKNDSLKFHYKVSSEANYDNLTFKLNDTEVFKMSGEVPWTIETVPVTAGTNKLEWTYSKDQSVSNGADCAWLDLIDFAGSSPVSYIQKDLQVARIVAPYQKDRYGQETVTLKVLNSGKDPINGFNLAYRVNDQGSPVKQVFDNVILPYADSVTISFSTRVNLSKFGAYNIVAYAYDNNDDYLLNDTLRIYLENNQLTDSLSVYPNPFTDQITLYVQSANADNLKISVISNSGAKFYEIEREITTGMNTLVISDLMLSPAIYYLKIKGSVIDKTLPIVKMRK